jgi:hypothetical protein
VREKDIWLFDVGEDAQRALLRREHLKPSKVGDICYAYTVLHGGCNAAHVCRCA